MTDTIAELLARFGEGAPMTEARPDPKLGPRELGDVPRAKQLIVDYFDSRDVDAHELVRLQTLLIELHARG